MSRLLNSEEAVVRLVRIMGFNRNPIGAFREQLFKYGETVNFKELQKEGYIKNTESSGTLDYFSSWIELSTKAKNLYNKVEINYRWD
jgi:hypothetical protein